LCHSYIYAKKNNYDFFIDSADWNYKYSLGWHDYFNSLIEIDDNIINNYNLIYFSHDNIFIDRNFTVNDYITCINDIYILNDSILKKGNDYINNIIKSKYTSLYIRRGDKLIDEAKYIHVNDIMKLININNSTKLYVQTDDYNVINEIKTLYPLHNIYYTVPTTSVGSYANQDYLKKDNKTNIKTIDDMNSTELKDHTEELLIGVYICSKSNECWCDVTSNVSRFIILNNKNIHVYPNDIKLDYDKKIIPWFNL